MPGDEEQDVACWHAIAELLLTKEGVLAQAAYRKRRISRELSWAGAEAKAGKEIAKSWKERAGALVSLLASEWRRRCARRYMIFASCRHPLILKSNGKCLARSRGCCLALSGSSSSYFSCMTRWILPRWRKAHCVRSVNPRCLPILHSRSTTVSGIC